MDWSQCSAVERDSLTMGNVWRFKGMRLAVESLFEHLDKGSTVDEFLEWFPGVTRTQVHEVLEFARESLRQPAKVA